MRLRFFVNFVATKNIKLMAKKIVTFGEVLLRFSKSGYKRIGQGNLYNGDFGGSEANVAVSLATLGDDIQYVTRLPKNQVGRACQLHLNKYNVGLDHIVWGGDRLGIYYFEEAAAIRNSNVIYDREASSFYSLKPGMIDWHEVLRGADVFHCSGISFAISRNAADAAMEAMEVADEMGLTISFDVNFRKNLWTYGVAATDVLPELCKKADIIFGDTGEYKVISGCKGVPFTATSSDYEMDLKGFNDWFEVVKAKNPRCKKFVMAVRNQVSTNHHVLTGLLHADGKLFSSRLYNIEQVVDPMGVGDAFIAAYLHAWLKWHYDDQRCLDFSLAASALKNTVPGDQNIVSEAEIEEAMDDPVFAYDGTD